MLIEYTNNTILIEYSMKLIEEQTKQEGARKQAVVFYILYLYPGQVMLN